MANAMVLKPLSSLVWMSPDQSMASTPSAMVTLNSRPSARRMGRWGTFPFASRVPVPQHWDDMKVKTRSGTTSALKTSFMVMRNRASVQKFGSTVTPILSPAFGTTPSRHRSGQGMKISCT